MKRDRPTFYQQGIMSPTKVMERGDALRACMKKLAEVSNSLGATNANILMFARRELTRLDEAFPDLETKFGTRAKKAVQTLTVYARQSCRLEPADIVTVREAIAAFLDAVSQVTLVA